MEKLFMKLWKDVGSDIFVTEIENENCRFTCIKMEILMKVIYKM